ncbi:MAG: SPOR domain-containing protein [Sphingomonas sp.]|uniref:SPOR domain-containing protein n=1 Tax=Sphingomonas sp. TaxID=28214 RepID=UPI0035A97063|nr:SPOR domain-containing protein [Sphingomonas sp.]
MNARMLPFAAVLLAAPVLWSIAPAMAGQLQMMPGPTPDADALAAEMRILGSNPFDLRALINAGELTLKLGDIDAAAAFFQRAERISPNNGEIKSGKARTLVQLGRPGEALGLFAEAEALGYDLESIGAERALAFDLIGEQERAQRTYRRALKRRNDDETQRRYALSLGISGKRDLALEQIDALLRRSDRAAWRVRAFVLAMTGDVPGAERIATSMLPGEMASGLLPFFRILPTLSAADRAFAVHFGEVRATPERIADARLIPVLPPLPYEAPPVQVAAQAVPVRDRATLKRDRRRGRGQPVAVATVAPPPPPIPQLPPPPRVVMVSPIPRASPTPPSVAPTVAQVNVPQVSAPAAESPVVLASRSARALDATPVPTLVTPPPPRSIPPVIVPVREVPVAVATTEARPLPPVPVEAPPRVTAQPVQLATLERVAPPPIVKEVAASVPTPVPTPVSPPPVAAPQTPVDTVAVQAPPIIAAPVPAPEAARPKPIASEESILARIIATIGVPASELGVGPVVAKPAEADAAEAPTAVAVASKPTLLDKKAAEKKATAEKAAAEKKLADKKAADEKAAKAKVAKANPARIWVQVAGGASVRDLPREWAKLRDKAPAAFKARGAYTTPLRFTNRLLAGPFKSDDEAQGFVNQIAKSGLTGFVFASEAGQKIDKLPAK